MSTNCYRLKHPFTSVRAETRGGGHTDLSIWVNHAKAGVIVLRNEEVKDFLLAIVRDVPAAIRSAIGDGLSELKSLDDELAPDTFLVSEHGEITCGKAIGVNQ